MNTSGHSIAITCLLILAFIEGASSFLLTHSSKVHSSSTTSTRTPQLIIAHGTSNKGDDFGNTESPGGDSYEGDIDWDAEWKKVVEKRDQPSSRPGKYKNDVERALLQSTKATSEQIKKVKIVKPEINIRSLQGDAKV